jgi:hypothetical protein
MITADEVLNNIDKRFQENVQARLAIFEKDLEIYLPLVTTTYPYLIFLDKCYVGEIEAARILKNKYRAAGWKVDLNERDCSIEFSLKKKSLCNSILSKLSSWCNSLLSLITRKRYLRLPEAHNDELLRRIEKELDEELGILTSKSELEEKEKL